MKYKIALFLSLILGVFLINTSGVKANANCKEIVCNYENNTVLIFYDKGCNHYGKVTLSNGKSAYLTKANVKNGMYASILSYLRADTEANTLQKGAKFGACPDKIVTKVYAKTENRSETIEVSKAIFGLLGGSKLVSSSDNGKQYSCKYAFEDNNVVTLIVDKKGELKGNINKINGVNVNRKGTQKTQIVEYMKKGQCNEISVTYSLSESDVPTWSTIFIGNDKKKVKENSKAFTSVPITNDGVATGEIDPGNSDNNKNSNEISSGSVGCDVFGEKTRQEINNIFNIIRVVGVILVLLLGIVDFVEAVISTEDNPMKKAFGRLKVRLICLVVLLLLPLLIKFLLEFIDKSDTFCGVGQ